MNVAPNLAADDRTAELSRPAMTMTGIVQCAARMASKTDNPLQTGMITSVTMRSGGGVVLPSRYCDANATMNRPPSATASTSAPIWRSAVASISRPSSSSSASKTRAARTDSVIVTKVGRAHYCDDDERKHESMAIHSAQSVPTMRGVARCRRPSANRARRRPRPKGGSSIRPLGRSDARRPEARRDELKTTRKGPDPREGHSWFAGHRVRD